MKALSIMQPWTNWIALGYKNIENRTWTTGYRGLVLLHAGQRVDGSCFDGDEVVLHRALYDRADVPKARSAYQTGGIVGYATITGCLTSSRSPWFTGPFGFRLENAHPLPFIPLGGQKFFFNVPADIEEQVRAIMAERNHHS